MKYCKVVQKSLGYFLMDFLLMDFQLEHQKALK